MAASAACQQPERVRRVGVLMAFPESRPCAQAFVAAFKQALARLGWVGGQNIHIDYRFAAGDPALFKAYAAELVRLAPDAPLASTAPLGLTVPERVLEIADEVIE